MPWDYWAWTALFFYTSVCAWAHACTFASQQGHRTLALFLHIMNNFLGQCSRYYWVLWPKLYVNRFDCQKLQLQTQKQKTTKKNSLRCTHILPTVWFVWLGSALCGLLNHGTLPRPRNGRKSCALKSYSCSCTSTNMGMNCRHDLTQYKWIPPLPPAVSATINQLTA